MASAAKDSAVTTNSDENKSSEYASVNDNDVSSWTDEFLKSEKNLLAMNVVSNLGTLESALSRKARLTHDHVYSIQIKNEGKPVTAQNSTGRCWLFAALNTMRIPFCQEYNIDNFEFSQGYWFFWDKFERSNYFLEQIIDTCNEDVNSRVVEFLLSKPTEDGGQFDMIVNIVEKYGLCPKDCFPETKSCEASRRLNWIVNTKLREYARKLRNLATKIKFDKNDKDVNNLKLNYEMLRKAKKQYLNELYNVFCIHFGTPPKEIKWAYRNKDKEYKVLEASSPLDFYNKYVRKHVNAREMVSLVNDPRNDYNKTYTVSRLMNVMNGERKEVLYLNLPINEIKQYAIERLKQDIPVWFGCDVGKHFYGDDGIMDMNVFDYKLTFDVEFGLSKAERLEYGVSLMTHAMVFTGVDIDNSNNNEIIKKWKVENSWGEKRGHKGYALMTDEWFDNYMYQLVVPKSCLKDKDLKLYQSYLDGNKDAQPTVLPPWDPMGSLAQ